MGSRPITFLWLYPATDHEPHCRHVPINKIWRWTESTPRSGWWRSHMAEIYSDCSTREIIIMGRLDGNTDLTPWHILKLTHQGAAPDRGRSLMRTILPCFVSSWVGADHGTSVRRCLLRRYRHGPGAEVSEGRRTRGILQPAELHRSDQRSLCSASARRHWQKGNVHWWLYHPAVWHLRPSGCL